MLNMEGVQNKKICSLEGLRFIAITLIIASHCDFLKQGGVGNCIFFALSGFLVSANLSKTSCDKDFNFKNTFKYYLKRIIRIIPMLWFFLIFTSILFYKQLFYVTDFSTDSSLLLNMFLIKPKGHLWFLQQEMLFYLCVPFILLFASIIKKIFHNLNNSQSFTNLLASIFVMILSFLFIVYMDKLPLVLYFNGADQNFFLGYFLIGVSVGYLYNAYIFSNIDLGYNKIFEIISNIVLVLFILFCVFSSHSFLKYINPALINYYIGWELQLICILFTCVVILCLLISKRSFMVKFYSNSLFSTIGNISFVMYLFHVPYILTLGAKNSYSFLKFTLVYFVTVCTSLIISKYIEKPLIALSKKLNIIINNIFILN